MLSTFSTSSSYPKWPKQYSAVLQLPKCGLSALKPTQSLGALPQVSWFWFVRLFLSTGSYFFIESGLVISRLALILGNGNEMKLQLNQPSDFFFQLSDWLTFFSNYKQTKFWHTLLQWKMSQHDFYLSNLMIKSSGDTSFHIHALCCWA